MKNILAIILFALSLPCHTNDLESVSNEITYFYLNPSSENFSRLQDNAASLENELKSAKNGALLFGVAIARIAEKHGWPIKDNYFGEIAKKALDQKSKLGQFVSSDAVNPTKLDIWWISFSATGDEIYLEKLLAYAGEELPKDDIKRLLIVSAATWSFESNCKQHEKVRHFAEKALKREGLSQHKKQFLKEAITNARESSLPKNSTMLIPESSGVIANSAIVQYVSELIHPETAPYPPHPGPFLNRTMVQAPPA